MRISHHTGVSFKEVQFPNTSNLDYDQIWRFLQNIPSLRGEKLPEKCGTDVWAAARQGFKCGSRGVVFAGSLQFNNGPGSLFHFRLAPMRLDHSHRLGRRYGDNRFLEIDVPDLTGRQLPKILEILGDRGRDLVIKWLIDGTHTLFGYTWKPFFVKTKERRDKKSSGSESSSEEKGSTYRVYFFAVDEPDPLHLDFGPMTITNLFHAIRPTEENKDESFLKLFTRTAIALSRNSATVILDRAQIRECEDLTFPRENPKGEVMTDGAGRISPTLALKVTQILGLSYPPSSFQGRIGSAKGVWTVEYSDKSGEDWIETSRSQRKWSRGTDRESDDSSQRTFEVLKCSGPLKSADLNVQFLPILINRANDKLAMKRTISKLLEEGLKQQVETIKTALESPQLLRKWLRENKANLSERLKTGIVPYRAGLPVSMMERLNVMLDAGFDPKCLLFMKHMVRRVFSSKCEELKKRLNIAVGKSAYAYMVPDFWGVLEPGEVYIDFSSFTDDLTNQSGALLRDDDLLVARAPAHFASDVQKVRAVAKAELMGLKDVVVFSTKGNPSLAAKLSGGDYDGDLAWICWEPTIVDNFNAIEVPEAPDLVKMGYIKKDTRTYAQLVKGHAAPVSVFLKAAFSFTMRPSMLGICTKWKARLCESRATIDSDEVVHLSALLSSLVDQAKSGFTFKEDDWTRFKREVIKMQPRPPGYKIDHMEGSITADLKAFTDRTVSKRLGEFHDLFKDPPSWDEDLATFGKQCRELSSRNDEWKILLDDLDDALASVKAHWATYWNLRSPSKNFSKDPDEDRPEFYPILDECFEKYAAIKPKLDTPITQLLLFDSSPPAELSQWSLLKASTLFASYGSKYGPKSVSLFPWLMAGRQLARLKGMYGNNGFPNTVVPAMFAMLKPDAAFVKRLEGENRNDLLDEDMADVRVDGLESLSD